MAIESNIGTASAKKIQTLNINQNGVRWKLIELKLGIMFLRSLYATGLSPTEALDELSRLQPHHADFWRGAARHTKTGKPLHTYLENRWPESLVSPIRIAEISGRLQEVFQGMEHALQQQIESQKLTTKIYYPIGVLVAGIAVAIFFITTVIPAMIGKMRFVNAPAIVTFSKWAQSFFADYGLFLLIGIITAVILAFWKWQQDDQLKTAVFKIINVTPVLGWATRWLWFSTWAKYVAIMIRADIPFSEIFRKTAKTLPIHLQDAVISIAIQLERGQGLTQSATPTKEVTDPRHLLPIHIINAFRMTDRAGRGAEQFDLASETLFEPGKAMLENSINTINNVAMLISGAFTVVPMLMYFQSIAAITKAASGH